MEPLVAYFTRNPDGSRGKCLYVGQEFIVQRIVADRPDERMCEPVAAEYDAKYRRWKPIGWTWNPEGKYFELLNDPVGQAG